MLICSICSILRTSIFSLIWHFWFLAFSGLSQFHIFIVSIFWHFLRFLYFRYFGIFGIMWFSICWSAYMFAILMFRYFDNFWDFYIFDSLQFSILARFCQRCIVKRNAPMQVEGSASLSGARLSKLKNQGFMFGEAFEANRENSSSGNFDRRAPQNDFLKRHVI